MTTPQWWRTSTNGGTVSDSLCELTGQLPRWTEAHNVLLEVRYLPGQSNVLADLLSRRSQVLGAEWSLHPQVAKKIICKWGVADHRLVRDPPQCEASSLLLPNPRPRSRLRGHLLPPMEGPRHILVSTLPSRRESGGQSQRNPKSLHD